MFSRRDFLRSAGLLAALSHLPVRAGQQTRLPRLKVSDNKRFLVKQDGSPFFYLGDTAWELFHRLNREDAADYLEDRAKKGFTVIQSVVLAEFGGLVEPNPYGHLPLENSDPTKPLEDYFGHVDWVVEKAASLGMYIGMLLTWGDKVNKKWGQGPEIFTPENARVFGEWLGRRYREAPIIWILGGDRPVEQNQHLAIWRAMADGLRAGDGGAHLISYHPQGRNSSANELHKEPWLDFNMLQSGHAQKNFANFNMLAKDYLRTPTKPCMDAEPCYEDHPVRQKKEEGWFDEWDVRKLAYWGVFAGAHGHTYGAHPIWAFWDGKGKKLADQRHTWREALQLPGATQAGYLRRLIESRPFLTRIPDQMLIATVIMDGPTHVQATRDTDGTYALIYSASGKPFAVDFSRLKAKRLKAWWFDPRTGKAQVHAEEMYNELGPVDFKPPTSGDGQDWVLVLDDTAKKYPVPGGGGEREV